MFKTLEISLDYSIRKQDIIKFYIRNINNYKKNK